MRYRMNFWILAYLMAPAIIADFAFQKNVGNTMISKMKEAEHEMERKDAQR